MASQLPPDPYAALGVPRTADTAAIKSSYRKLVLKCHPDKFPDEALKAQKQEEFQRIQQAYELIGDEQARSAYDAQVRLAELKREHLERSRKETADGPRVEVRSSYKVRTAAPAYFTSTKSSPTEPKARAFDEADRYHEEQRSASRKHEGYDASSRRPVRSEREDKSRSDKKKTRDREERRERSSKFYVDDDSDERARHESGYRRRSEENRLREEAKKKLEEARKVAELQAAEDKHRESRRRPDYSAEYERKYNGAREYIERIEKTRAGPADDSRPPLPRVNSGSSTQYVRRSGDRPVEVRRSRASREQSYADISEAPEFKPPSLEKSYSTPANIKVTRVSPQRTRSHDHDRSPPRLHRSETEPIRRKDAAPSQPSKLRDSAVPHDSGYSSSSTPEVQYRTPQSTAKPSSGATTTKMYRYTTGPGGVSVAVPEDYDYPTGHRTILREPGRYRQRSPSPIRESKHEYSTSSRATPVHSGIRYTAAMPRPPLAHHSSSARMEDIREEREQRERERGRDRTARGPLYGETMQSAYRRAEKPGSSSFNMEDVHFAPRYGKNDVQFSGYGSKKPFYTEKASWDDERPRLSSRSATTVH